MIRKLFSLLLFLAMSVGAFAQLVSVQADYNSYGDCVFGATNNSKVPMFLHINFADIENTTFNEPLPYIKHLETGYNSLFTLQRDPDADVPRFNYEIKTFRSNPAANVNLDFPYLIPLEEGRIVQVFDVKNIDGFWGTEGLESWHATGFIASPGESVFASRNGIVAEVVGETRTGDSRLWYHTWTNSITLLQPDGTLICYHNVICDPKKLVVGEKIFAGQKVGEIARGSNELIIMVFHDSLFTKTLSFVIPEFVVHNEGGTEILNSSKTYNVFHPLSIRSMEMTKREKKRINR